MTASLANQHEWVLEPLEPLERLKPPELSEPLALPEADSAAAEPPEAASAEVLPPGAEPQKRQDAPPRAARSTRGPPARARAPAPAPAPASLGRLVDADELIPHLGGLFTREELDLILRQQGDPQPLSALPRIAPLEPASGCPTLVYRRLVYGPYDHLEVPPDAELYTFRHAAHLGQTKLCCVELEALTQAFARVPTLKYLVYAGAAPGLHVPFIAEAFPGLEMHLYDPAEFKLRTRAKTFPSALARIHVHQGLFTDDTACEWAGRGDEIFFVSDIRSGSHCEDDFEQEVWQNMLQQQHWWGLMRPAAALLKFRPPYTDGRTRTTFTYLDGTVLLQPFSPHTSSEGRLLVWRGAPARTYDAQLHENFYFWLNTVAREWASYSHGLALERVSGLCRCFDCARLVQTFREYAAARPPPGGPESADALDARVGRLIERMVLATGQSLTRSPHGKWPDLPQAAKRLQLAREFGALYEQRRRKKIKGHLTAIKAAPPVVQRRGGGGPAPPAARGRGDTVAPRADARVPAQLDRPRRGHDPLPRQGDSAERPRRDSRAHAPGRRRRSRDLSQSSEFVIQPLHYELPPASALLGAGQPRDRVAAGDASGPAHGAASAPGAPASDTS